MSIFDGDGSNTKWFRPGNIESGDFVAYSLTGGLKRIRRIPQTSQQEDELREECGFPKGADIEYSLVFERDGLFFSRGMSHPYPILEVIFNGVNLAEYRAKR